MSSLKSYFRKKHRYETQADLKNMTAEQIVSLNPSEVGFYIEQETGGVPLEGVKKKALWTLLAIKRQNKATPNERARQGAISRFLDTEGIRPNPEVDNLIANTQTEMVQENMAKMREQLELKDMTNRLRALDNRPPIPDTEEEAMSRRLNGLQGGKRSKTVSKRKRREKTRKGRKGKKGRKTNRRRK
jgi:hypothetical protein